VSVTSILDTGPLVAFLKRDEEHHAWALDAFKSLPSDGVVTCEAVLCEATFLLSRLPAAIDALFGKLADGSLRLMPLETESDAIHAMM
jgi:predicted nucleic acid-binding protein